MMMIQKQFKKGHLKFLQHLQTRLPATSMTVQVILGMMLRKK
jgi:hypothetical protein